MAKSKKNKKNAPVIVFQSGSEVMAALTEHRGKGGVIKVRGKNGKKKTKALKRACVHHIYTKKGKPGNYLRGKDGRLYCRGCGSEIEMKQKEDNEVKKLKRDMLAYLNRSVYLMVEAGAADDPVCAQAIMVKESLPRIFKTTKRTEEALRSKNNKKKKGKKGNDRSGYEAVKGWIHKG